MASASIDIVVPRATVKSRRWAMLLGVVVALSVLASCGAIRTQVDLTSHLRRKGFNNVKVHTDETNGFSTVTVNATRGGGSGSDAQDEAAKVVWTTFPRRVDAVVSNIDSSEKTYTRSDLQDRFGARPAGYDKKTVGDDLKSIGIGVIIALAIGGVLCIGLIVLIVVLVRNSRRKRRQAQGPYSGYPGGGYPGGPPPPQGYPGAPGQGYAGPPPGYQPPGYQPPGYPAAGGPSQFPSSGDASQYPPPPPT